MTDLRSLLSVSVLVLSLAACGTSAAPATATPFTLFAGVSTATMPPSLTTVEPAASLPPTMVSQPPARPEFTVAVIVDRTTEQVSQEQAKAVIDEAGKFLKEFSPYGLLLTDFTEDSSGGSTADMAARYAVTRSASLPNGLVIFSAGDNGQAKASGGCGYGLALGGTFRNVFVSPATGANQIYVAVVDYNYKYMACGYGGGDSAQSSISLPGECGGQTGVACVPHNGYSMCSNAVDHLYTSTPTYAVSSMVVHGLLHNFGPNGDRDHYATPECSARMGYPAGFFDLQESEYYNGLCPFVYEEFTKSYQP